MKIEKDKVAGINYSLQIEAGVTMESNEGYAPIEFLHGAGNIVEGLERGLEGVQVGECRTIVVEPVLGYGMYDPEKIYELPREPHHMELHAGDMLKLKFGQEVVLLDTGPERIKVDENHPLAGKTLTFVVNVVYVRDASPQELHLGFPSHEKDYCGPPGCC